MALDPGEEETKEEKKKKKRSESGEIPVLVGERRTRRHRARESGVAQYARRECSSGLITRKINARGFQTPGGGGI